MIILALKIDIPFIFHMIMKLILWRIKWRNYVQILFVAIVFDFCIDITI